jgi:hypothetical protein
VWEEASGRFRGEIRQKRAGTESLYLHFPPLDAAPSREDALLASAHNVGKRLRRSINQAATAGPGPGSRIAESAHG